MSTKLRLKRLAKILNKPHFVVNQLFPFLYIIGIAIETIAIVQFKKNANCIDFSILLIFPLLKPN